MKTCSKCKIEKEESEFYKQKSRRNCLRSECKECMLNESKKYNKNNKEKRNEYRKEWRKNNKDNSSVRQKEQRKKLPDYYIKAKLGVKNPPPELIEMKREQLTIHRLIKEMENETIR